MDNQYHHHRHSLDRDSRDSIKHYFDALEGCAPLKPSFI
jgi:hypothetical protein